MQKIHFDLNEFLQEQKELKDGQGEIYPDTEDPLRIGMTQRAVKACTRHMNEEYEKILISIRTAVGQGQKRVALQILDKFLKNEGDTP